MKKARSKGLKVESQKSKVEEIRAKRVIFFTSEQLLFEEAPGRMPGPPWRGHCLSAMPVSPAAFPDVAIATSCILPDA